MRRFIYSCSALFLIAASLFWEVAAASNKTKTVRLKQVQISLLKLNVKVNTNTASLVRFLTDGSSSLSRAHSCIPSFLTPSTIAAELSGQPIQPEHSWLSWEKQHTQQSPLAAQVLTPPSTVTTIPTEPRHIPDQQAYQAVTQLTPGHSLLTTAEGLPIELWEQEWLYPDDDENSDDELPSLLPAPVFSAFQSSLLSVEQLLSHGILEDDAVPTTDTYSNTRLAELNLKTCVEPDDETPFPELEPDSAKRLSIFSRALNRLAQCSLYQNNPLEKNSHLQKFIQKYQDENATFDWGGHSLVMKWPQTPGYVLKISRGPGHDHRFAKEAHLYRSIQSIKKPGMEQLGLHTCSLLAGFRFAERPVLIIREQDFIANLSLATMNERSLFDRLDFALTWIWRFLEINQLFLDQGILLGDRHGGNIGINNMHLPAAQELKFAGVELRIPAMLDLDPWWSEDDSTTLLLSLPTWVPVATELLTLALNPDNFKSEQTLKLLNDIRCAAMPYAYQVFPNVPASTLLASWLEDVLKNQKSNTADKKEQAIIKEVNKWLPRIFSLPEYSSSEQNHAIVAEWIERLTTETETIQKRLKRWKAESSFSLLKACQPCQNQLPQSQKKAQPSKNLQDALIRMGAKLQCDNCTRSFSTLKRLQSHQKDHKIIGKLSYCPECAGAVKDLHSHQLTHTGEKPNQCSTCKKNFSTNSNLKKHELIHTGAKPFKCEVCHKRFLLIDNMRKHLATHGGKKLYGCKTCNMDFLQKQHLITHLRTHSGEKPYQCETCGRKFTQISGLIQHNRRTHIGVKPYKCKLCPKQFTDKGDLKRHQVKHTKEKPYGCKICLKNYSQCGHLLRHLRKTHNINTTINQQVPSNPAQKKNKKTST